MPLSLTNPALEYDQSPQIDPTSGLSVTLPPFLKFFKNPASRAHQFAKDTSKQVQPSYATFQGQIPADETVPTPLQNAGDTVHGQDNFTTQMQDAPPPVLPKFVQPSFQDVSQGPMGTPAPINAGETKLGKLLHVVRAITQGGLEGSTQGTFGAGFKAAGDAPYQDAYRSIGLQNAELQNQQQQATIAMLPWQRAQQIAAFQKTQAETQKEKFLTPRGGGVYDTSKSAYAPNAGPTEQNGDQQAIDYLTSNPDPQTGRPLTAPEAVARVAQLKQDVKPDANPTEAALAVAAAAGDPKAEAALKRLDQSRREGRPVNINQDAVRDAIESTAQSLARGDLTRLKDITSLRGDQRLLVFNRAKQINPNFNTSQIDRMIKMEDAVTNGKDGQNIQSFGTFLEHAGEASRVVNSVRQAGSPIINKPLNWWRKNVSGSPYYQQFITALEPVRKEFEGFLLGGRALYGEDRKAAETILSDDSSPAQIQSALKQMGHTAKARFNEINYRYKRVRGKDIEDPFSPEAIEGARQIGVDVSSGSGEVTATGPNGHKIVVRNGGWVDAATGQPVQ